MTGRGGDGAELGPEPAVGRTTVLGGLEGQFADRGDIGRGVEAMGAGLAVSGLGAVGGGRRCIGLLVGAGQAVDGLSDTGLGPTAQHMKIRVNWS